MSIDLEEYQKLKARALELKAESDRASGALEQHMRTLKEDFGCDTVEEAKKLLAKMEEEEAKYEAEYKQELERFEEKWGKDLGRG